MPRYAKGYRGERRTEPITIKLTPSERAGLEEAARAAGTTLSQLGRELCLRRATSAAAGVRRDPERRALVSELTSIGNNLNQLTKLSHTHGSLPHFYELKEATDQLKATFVRVMLSYDPAH